MATTQTIDSTVLDLIADDHVLKCLSQIVATERAIRDIYAQATPTDDITTRKFPTMMDAAFALSSPLTSSAINEAQTARRIAIDQARNRQSDAFESLTMRVKLVSQNLVRAEAGQ